MPQKGWKNKSDGIPRKYNKAKKIKTERDVNT